MDELLLLAVRGVGLHGFALANRVIDVVIDRPILGGTLLALAVVGVVLAVRDGRRGGSGWGVWAIVATALGLTAIASGWDVLRAWRAVQSAPPEMRQTLLAAGLVTGLGVGWLAGGVMGVVLAVRVGVTWTRRRRSGPAQLGSVWGALLGAGIGLVLAAGVTLAMSWTLFPGDETGVQQGIMVVVSLAIVLTIVQQTRRGRASTGELVGLGLAGLGVLSAMGLCAQMFELTRPSPCWASAPSPDVMRALARWRLWTGASLHLTGTTLGAAPLLAALLAVIPRLRQAPPRGRGIALALAVLVVLLTSIAVLDACTLGLLRVLVG